MDPRIESRAGQLQGISKQAGHSGYPQPGKLERRECPGSFLTQIDRRQPIPLINPRIASTFRTRTRIIYNI